MKINLKAATMNIVINKLADLYNQNETELVSKLGTKENQLLNIQDAASKTEEISESIIEIAGLLGVESDSFIEIAGTIDGMEV